MPDDSLRMDGDDASELVVEIERSFEIDLGSDLSEVVTVGDLHNAILREIGEPSGTICPTSRIFYQLRAILRVPTAVPATGLAAVWKHSPRSLRFYIQAQTGLVLPALAIGWFGCTVLVASALLALIAGWQVSGLVVPPILILGLIVFRMDRGSWSGDWKTLGPLTRAVAAHNHAVLAKRGARNSSATTWHALTSLIAGYGIERDRIGRDTRLCG